MIEEILTQLRKKEVSPEALVEECFSHIKEKDNDIAAFLGTRVGAKEEAGLLKEEENQKPLFGIPAAVKDNFCIEGEEVSAGSKILEGYRAPYTSTAVERLREAGAIIVGRTNMDEFACGSSTENSAYQVTKNPFDIARVAGGSSGGSAAAVAAGMVPFALGSDTGGSIRQPAAYCGVVGLKPTYGRISRHGLIAMASSLDTVGTFTKTVEDAALLLSVLAGEDKYDATCAPLPQGKSFHEKIGESLEGVRIGIPKEYFAEELDGEIKKILEEKIESLRSQGAEIIDISLPHTKFALPTYYIIQPAEVSSNLARFDGIRYGKRDQGMENKNISALLATYFNTREKYLGAEIKRRIMLGTHILSAGYYDAYYKKAQKVRGLLKKDFENAFEKVDVILSPTTPDVAFRMGEKEDPLTMYLADIYTVTANLAGIPAISVPIGTKEIDGKKLPVGGQLVAKWFDEETLFQVAAALETQL